MAEFAKRNTNVATDEVSELNRRLDEHSNILMRDSREYARLAREAVNARNTYDVVKAKAQLKVRIECKGFTVDEKKAQVLLMCEPQMVDARIAEAHLDAMKQRLRSVSDSLTAVQTKAALLKTESNLNNYKT